MNQIPFRHRPAFRSAVLGVLLLGIYAYYLIFKGGIWVNLAGIVADLILLALLYQACIFFYAQFILPTRTLEERRRIADRMRLHASGGHGPAIFIKNGRTVERTGESRRRGPGLLWIDTASAVVTRTAVTFKQVLGPGVHFIDRNEQIGSVISLHPQTQTIGAIPMDEPFEPISESANQDAQRQHAEMISRCNAVRGITRDGIEVIPTISVTFKINARPAGTGETGSRFGFNAEAVERAARAEGINPNSSTEEKRRVAWNQLPGLMAAELWREYLSKYTLSELFDPGLKALPPVRQPEVHAETVAVAPKPLVLSRGLPTRLLRAFNNGWERELESLTPPEEPPAPDEELPVPQPAGAAPFGQPGLTALQVINQMIKARLSQAIVVKLDECGRLTDAQQPSDEYRKLDERGIVVLGASVTALRFNPTVERQLLSRWKTSWLSNALKDQDRIERLEMAYKDDGRHQALLDHALTLAEAINRAKPASVPAAIKTLLDATEAEIRSNDALLSDAAGELESLQAVDKWLEDKP